MVPDDRGGAERNHITGLLEPPAKIDVISRLMIFRIETADALKRPSMKRHVTARNVFGNGIGEQNVTGTAWRRRDTGLNPVLGRRRHVRTAYSGIAAAQESGDQIIEPIDVCHAVRIGISKHFALR